MGGDRVDQRWHEGQDKYGNEDALMLESHCLNGIQRNKGVAQHIE
jgi:hypothetical protein